MFRLSHIYSIALVCTCLPSSLFGVDEVSRILKELDSTWYNESSYAEIKMEIRKSKFDRNVKLKYWSKGKDKTLILITHPPKESGNSTLKSGDVFFNYFKKTDRQVQISSNMGGGEWMSSHFTNDDLTRSTRFSDDFTGVVKKRKKTKKGEILDLTLKPKKNVATPWARIETVYNKSKKVPLTQKFYTKRGRLRRTMVFTKLKKIKKRWTPMVVTLTPELSRKKSRKKKEFTKLIYTKLKRSHPNDDSIFTLTHLKALP